MRTRQTNRKDCPDDDVEAVEAGRHIEDAAVSDSDRPKAAWLYSYA